MTYDDVYGLDKRIQSLAVANEFAITMNKACYKLGQSLRPFCIYADDMQKSNFLVDFALFNGLVGGTSLIDEICEYRKGVFSNIGINIDIQNEIKRKWALYDYLLSMSVCYVEVPRFKTKDGYPMATYDKFLCTRNPMIMAAWMGDTSMAMQAKYSARIRCNVIDYDNNELRFVKLNMTQKGNTITAPRGTFDVTKMTCVPLFMLSIFIQGLKPYLENGILRFVYMKDNGQQRVLESTLSSTIMMEYYNDNNYVSEVLGAADVDKVKQGALSVASSVGRGYIRVPELGASIYDSGVRALNVARVLQIQQIDSVDRQYIHVDLKSVSDSFKYGCDYIVKTMPEYIYQVYTDITGENAQGMELGQILSKLYSDIDTKVAFLSTMFLRSLHTYMVSNPVMFPKYTGTPISSVVSSSITDSSDFGVETMDFL